MLIGISLSPNVSLIFYKKIYGRSRLEVQMIIKLVRAGQVRLNSITDYD
jgi:hypothetical protein